MPDEFTVGVHQNVHLVTVVRGSGDDSGVLVLVRANLIDNFGKSLGPPRGLQRESGKICDLDARICDEFDLKDPSVRGSDLHAFVVLRDSEGATV